MSQPSENSSQGLPEDHLSRITTLWSVVQRAHGEDADAAQAAQSEMMQRYSGAVYRYLCKVLRDADAADEVFQEFALRFLRGGFRRAMPERGRFRSYLKTSLFHLVADYRNRRRRQGGVDADLEQWADEAEVDRRDEAFAQSCREELLARAWEALRVVESLSARPLHAVLDYRARHPRTSSEEMARELTARRKPEKPYTAATIRKTLQAAREKFVELLLYEVRQTTAAASDDELREEVAALGLTPYCASGLDRSEQS